MVQNTPADWQGDYVSFHRNNRTRDFTVMGNIHLRDKNLSLKAVGLLSKMLSFNDSWQFSKEVFSLRVLGELSYQDIAKLFGKTESWARVTFHRAKLKIIEQVKEESYE